MSNTLVLALGLTGGFVTLSCNLIIRGLLGIGRDPLPWEVLVGTTLLGAAVMLALGVLASTRGNGAD